MNPKPVKKKSLRKPIRRVSVARAKRLVEYEKLKKEWLKAHEFCWKCEKWIKGKIEIHHKHGRRHDLLTEQRLFIALCRECHEWVHNNTAKARACGLLAPIGQWNHNPFKLK